MGKLLHEDGSPLSNKEIKSIKKRNQWIRDNGKNGETLRDLIGRSFYKEISISEWEKIIDQLN